MSVGNLFHSFPLCDMVSQSNLELANMSSLDSQFAPGCPLSGFCGWKYRKVTCPLACPRVWKPELWSSCMHSKGFNHRAFPNSARDSWALTFPVLPENNKCFVQ